MEESCKWIFFFYESIPLVFDSIGVIPWTQAKPLNTHALGKSEGCRTHDVGRKPSEPNRGAHGRG